MVLKKSNSPFNSGATQKCFRKGVYRSMKEPSELQLTIALSGLPSRYDEKNPSWEHEKALKKIYDYLGYSGPSLKQLHTSVSYFHWIKTRKSLSISLNRRGLWMIPERIDELMKESNFFEGEEEKELAEIRIHKVKNIADRDTIHNKEKRILNPKQKKKYVNPFSRKTRKMKSKVKVKGKKRGVQRTHLFTPANSTYNYFDDHDDDYWIEERRRKYIDIELQEIDQMDARVLGCNQAGYTEWSKMKHSPKSKGCVNGKRAYLYKAYSAPQMRGEINRVMNSDNVWAEDDDSDICDDIDDKDVVDEQLEDQYTYHYQNREKICDYFKIIASTECHTPKKKHKRGHRKDNLNTNETQLVNVNTASSQTTIKHPKGSYQVIERPRDVFQDTEITATVDDDFVIVDRDDVQVQVLDVDNSEHAQEQDISIPKVEIPVVFNTFETQDSFVSVSLQFPKEFKDVMTESLLQSNCYSLDLNECSVMFGNCFPPVFCVSLENDWNLIGTSRSDIDSFNDLEWEVTLKNTKSCSENDNVKNNFLFRLGLTNGCSVQFHDLIGMARDSVRIGLGDVVSRIVLAQKMKNALASNNNSTLTYDVCSMEEALRRLEGANQCKKFPNSEPKTETAGHIEIPREIVECDVCLNTCNEHGQSDTGLVTLLPCNHSFCHQCWLSHIFFHVTTGSPKISCMQTGCKEVINETALRALVPENDLAKWHRQRQERFIDTSPLCQWCPKPTCNKVSVIQEGGQHVQQFGCAVVCDCNNSYCFSCQKNPHWPMSCDQAAAYRNLLFKLGCEIPVEVTCNVELKPCPGCRYPIEKTEGCPHMVCRMCDLDFCWNCLQPTDNHSVWKCTGDEDSKFVTYKLHNDVKNSFPLKFFTDALGMRKKHRFVNRENVHGWIKALERTDCKKIKLSFERSVQLEDTVLVKSRAVNLATASVSFLLDSYSFLEYFYILVSFALLNEEEEKNKSFNASTQRVIERLVHTASRLEDLVVGRSIGQLVNCESTSRMYLSTGLEMLDNLKRRVAFVQRTSQDVPAGPIGELDPTQHYRYT